METIFDFSQHGHAVVSYPPAQRHAKTIQMHPGWGEPFRPVYKQYECIHTAAHLVLGEMLWESDRLKRNGWRDKVRSCHLCSKNRVTFKLFTATLAEGLVFLLMPFFTEMLQWKKLWRARAALCDISFYFWIPREINVYGPPAFSFVLPFLQNWNIMYSNLFFMA